MNPSPRLVYVAPRDQPDEHLAATYLTYSTISDARIADLTNVPVEKVAEMRAAMAAEEREAAR